MTVRVLASAVPILLVALGGCIVPAEEESQTPLGSPCGPEGRDLKAGTLSVSWQGPGRSERTHSKQWTSRGPECRQGAARLSWSDSTIEGSDHELVVTARFDHTPVRLSYAPGVATANTFDFTYREAAFWAGKELNHLVDVRQVSWVDVTRWDNRTGSIQIALYLDFDSDCKQDEFNCQDEKDHRTILSGSTR